MKAFFLMMIFLSACTHQVKPEGPPEEEVVTGSARPDYKESMRFKPGVCFTDESGTLYRMLSANEELYVYKRLEDFKTYFTVRKDFEDYDLNESSCPAPPLEPDLVRPIHRGK